MILSIAQKHTIELLVLDSYRIGDNVYLSKSELAIAIYGKDHTALIDRFLVGAGSSGPRSIKEWSDLAGRRTVAGYAKKYPPALEP